MAGRPPISTLWAIPLLVDQILNIAMDLSNIQELSHFVGRGPVYEAGSGRGWSWSKSSAGHRLKA